MQVQASYLESLGEEAEERYGSLFEMLNKIKVRYNILCSSINHDKNDIQALSSTRIDDETENLDNVNIPLLAPVADLTK